MPLYLTEYAQAATDGSGAKIAAGHEPATAEQNVTLSGASVQSGAFSDVTRFVMVHADEACHPAFGSDPVASSERHRLGAGETRFYGVFPGHKLAAVAGA